MKTLLSLALVLLISPLSAMDVIPSVKVLNKNYNTISERKLQLANREMYEAVRDRIVEAFVEDEEQVFIEFFTNENGSIFLFPDIIKIDGILIDAFKRHLENKGYNVDKVTEDNKITLVVTFNNKK